MDKEILNLLDQEWYVHGYVGAISLIYPFGTSGIEMKKYYGFSYNKLMYLIKNDYGEMFYNVNELKNVYQKLFANYKNDKNYFTKIRIKYKATWLHFMSLREELDNINFSKLKDEKLISYYKKINEMASESVGIGHIIEAFSLESEGEILKKISESKKSNVNKYIINLTNPISPSWVNDNERDLYKISKIKNLSKRDEMLKLHAKKYFWIRNNYQSGVPLTWNDFKLELESLENFHIPNYDKIISEKKKIIQELKLNNDTIELIHLIEFFIDFQDERKKNILISLHYVERILSEFSRRYKINNELIKYSLPNELLNKIVSGKSFEKILKERRKGFFLIITKNGNKFVTGKDFNEIEEKLLSKLNKNISNLRGMGASGGTSIGKAVICKSIEAIKKIKEGDILVASMTRPEFVPAMKKAAAFVTDEGGVTCHAAIIAREMGKPCVIGTKIATKVLKDGDLVEVRGNQGLVIKLK